MLIERHTLVDLEALGDNLRVWFVEKDWDIIKTERGASAYTIVAKKESELRQVFAACRALTVICRHEGGSTKIKVSQGDWTKNLLSNLAWFAVTGGTNLAFSLWSFEVQREFQNFAQETLNQMPPALGQGGTTGVSQ